MDVPGSNAVGGGAATTVAGQPDALLTILFIQDEDCFITYLLGLKYVIGSKMHEGSA